MKVETLSIATDTQAILRFAQEAGIETVWDRLQAQEPQCGYCALGVSCRNCTMGPCRVDPFGDGPQKGVCGADADIIVARNLARTIAAGASSHSDHGRDILETFYQTGLGKTTGYEITDVEKLRRIAAECGIEVDGKEPRELARELGWLLLEDFGSRKEAITFVQRAPKARQELWHRLGITPRGIDRENVETLHRTHMGVDNDYVNILLHGLRTSLSDGWGGSMIATELSDILFGTPKPRMSYMNLGALKADHVNIALHGHNPMLSDVIVRGPGEGTAAAGRGGGRTGDQPGGPLLHGQRGVDAPWRPDGRQPPPAGTGYYDRGAGRNGGGLSVYHALGGGYRQVFPHSDHHDL